MVDNLALLIAHVLLTLAVLRSLRADRSNVVDKNKSWRSKPRA